MRQWWFNPSTQRVYYQVDGKPVNSLLFICWPEPSEGWWKP